MKITTRLFRSRNSSGVVIVIGLSTIALLISFLIATLLPAVESATVDARMRLRYWIKPADCRSAHKDIVLVEIDDTAIRTLGRWGAGSWLTRKPFLDQLSFFNSQLVSPAVVAYDIIFQENMGILAENKGRITESYEKISEIIDELEKIRKKADEIIDIKFLDDINRLTLEQGNAALAVRCAEVSESKKFSLLMGCYFRGGIFASDTAQKIEAWSDKDIFGDSNDGDESKGERIPYLLDIAIPSTDVTFKDEQSTEGKYKYCVNALLPSRDLLDYVLPASLNGMPDSMGIVRKMPLIIGFEYNNKHRGEKIKRFVPSFGFLSYLIYCGVKFPLQQGVVKVILGDRIDVKTPKYGKISIPIDENGNLYLNCENKLVDFSRVNFVDTIRYNYSQRPYFGEKSSFAKFFDNKIIVIALTATGYDVGHMPLGGPVPLVLAHLTVLDNLLTKHFLAPLMPLPRNLVILVIWLLFTVICVKEKSSRLGFIAISIIIIYMILSFGCIYYNISILPFVVPSFYVAFCSFEVMVYRFFTEERAKRRIRGMFASMVSEKVLTFLEETPDSFSLKGHNTEATVFFSDIEEFTSISESLPPAKLTVFLNEYLTPVTNNILNSGGYLDKYIGDGIMAVWGAPYKDPQHAVRACLSAIEQQTIIDELNTSLKVRYGYQIRVRMGINSGIVTAGNMGSEKKFQYTVIGDVVNLAARLEPVNKDFGTKIIIGDTTYNMVKDYFIARPLIKIQVKGKNIPVLIYELLCRKEDSNENIQRIRETYIEALDLFCNRQWDESERKVKEILSFCSDDGPSLCLLKLIHQFRTNSPPPTWNGEYIRTVKN